MANNTYDYLGDLTLDKNTGLYDLFISTYNGNTVQLRAFFLEKKHEMRMDIVSNDIYKTTDYVGTLCQLNSILLPFSVNAGDIIFFCSISDAQSLMKVSKDISQSRIEELVNAGKSTLTDLSKKSKLDANRSNYTTNRDQSSQSPITPTRLGIREQNITASNGFIVIGDKLGNNNSFLGQANNFDSSNNDMLTLNDMLANNYKNNKTSSASAGDGVLANATDSSSYSNSNYGSSASNTNGLNSDSLALLQEVLASSDGSSQYGSYDGGDSTTNGGDSYQRILIKKYIRKI